MSILEEFVTNREKIDRYPEEDIRILEKCADIDTGGMKGYEIGVFDGFDKIAWIEYYVFETSDTGYIGWLSVEEEWRRQGIAREIRQQAVDHLLKLGVTEIWSGPVADILQPLVREQGFEPAHLEEFSDYYVYKK